MTFNKLVIISLLGVFCGLYSCSSIEQTTDGTVGPESTGEQNISETETTGLDLSLYRNQLSDVYASQQHDIPEIFMQTYQDNRLEGDNLYDGYRIQILSTRDLELADSIATSFRIWADTSLAGFNPETYQTFKQPHFRVHVGDFHDRDRAISFTRLVKNQYPDAWVVHDRIDPNRVPSDTTEIRLRPPEEEENDENIEQESQQQVEQ